MLMAEIDGINYALNNSNWELFMKDLEARFLGKHIEYIKVGGRLGWIGEITFISQSKVHVLYSNGKSQEYSIYALEGVTNTHVHTDQDQQYLRVIPKQIFEDIKYFMVLDSQGRQVYKGIRQEMAEKQAEGLAKEDNMGRPFYLLQTIAKYQREIPPVKRTEL